MPTSIPPPTPAYISHLLPPDFSFPSSHSLKTGVSLSLSPSTGFNSFMKVQTSFYKLVYVNLWNP